MGTSAVQVAIANGRIEGMQFDRHQAFLGIPFAAPPTGCAAVLRAAPPQSWSGVRPANAFANSAIQGTSPMPGTAASGPRDEDCLFLNVYTPAADNAKRPVFFWIHGGGFTLGSGFRAVVRRLAAGRARRRRGGDDPLPPRRARLSLSRRARRREVGRHRERGATRSDRRARMGARQHRGVRRRPDQRDDRRRIGRVDGVRDAARDAGRTRPVQARHPAERRGQSVGHRRNRREARGARAGKTRHCRIERREDSRRAGRSSSESAARRIAPPARRSRSRRSSTARRFR